MSNLKYVTTISLGAEEALSQFPIEHSEVVRYSFHEMHPYATNLALVSHVFCRAQLLSEEKVLKSPYRVSVVLEGAADQKYKHTDFDTKLERVIWWFKNAAAPSCGIVIQFYINHDCKSFLDSPYSFSSLWHANKRNNGQDSNFVTFTPHVEMDWNNGKSSHRRHGFEEQLKLCKEKCIENGYDVHDIDYTTSIEEASRLLVRAKCHIGYIGSVHYLAAFHRTPTLTVGKHVPGVHPNLQPYGLTRARHYEHLAPEYELDIGKMRVWNHVGTPPGRTLQYHFKECFMYQDEPRYYTMAEPTNLEHTKTELMRMIL